MEDLTLEVRRLYEIRCRNLQVGAYTGRDDPRFGPMFIGIREKFYSEFLDSEPARVIQALPEVVPDEIDLVESHRHDGKWWRNQALFDFLAVAEHRLGLRPEPGPRRFDLPDEDDD